MVNEKKKMIVLFFDLFCFCYLMLTVMYINYQFEEKLVVDYNDDVSLYNCFDFGISQPVAATARHN